MYIVDPRRLVPLGLTCGKGRVVDGIRLVLEVLVNKPAISPREGQHIHIETRFHERMCPY